MTSTEFDRGYVIACCNLVNLHQDTVAAADILRALDVTRQALMAMDLADYDRRALDSILTDRPDAARAA